VTDPGRGHYHVNALDMVVLTHAAASMAHLGATGVAGGQITDHDGLPLAVIVSSGFPLSFGPTARVNPTPLLVDVRAASLLAAELWSVFNRAGLREKYESHYSAALAEVGASWESWDRQQQQHGGDGECGGSQPPTQRRPEP